MRDSNSPFNLLIVSRAMRRSWATSPGLLTNKDILETLEVSRWSFIAGTKAVTTAFLDPLSAKTPDNLTGLTPQAELCARPPGVCIVQDRRVSILPAGSDGPR